ncbi:acetyl-CoA carboxylase biotin carboxylase subunit [Vallitalea guaymasensis]|uniref:Biotin carboxylase n=1 Tax=Vallitalea guaymasensis TaxID=1185412 RepID=A0A8J8SCH6_9FIRM|nr:acetyl-CoA carboxylase biotin carboxylase subunit [Vallitalea guaymasensis]QUH29441.1 acetyl-CoA carboxylase biotin carboxylase subunit [Vallitalea guaymasensis]
MFNKILIANRGEIAVRIIRACREMNIQTVAVYSDIDKEALHTQLADEAICIGPAPAKDSYLDIKRIISAAIVTGANAIHPGFGFLSENSKFAKVCEECNITFIGPTGDMMDRMGNKSKARETMIENNIPVVPGSEGAVDGIDEAIELADSIGYPVIIKASAGGGGRGMRIANSREELVNSYKTASAEAKSAFGDDTMYLEKYVTNPRHIEFQILADNYGNTVHLGERDCSMQRRHQKVLEESPSAAIDDELRKRMGKAAVKAAKAINYKNAGTVEFLLSDSGEFYFIEMNTRIQVEHPVTEMVTGIDLIKEQIRIADGEKLNYTQKDVKIEGHAIECRVNAENPSKGFRPSPGEISFLHMPSGKDIRVDSAIYCGYKIPPTYDSMIAKLIVYDKDRKSAIKKLNSAIGEFIVEGIDTNIDFQYDLINNESFVKGNYNTSFIEKLMEK